MIDLEWFRIWPNLIILVETIHNQLVKMFRIGRLNNKSNIFRKGDSNIYKSELPKNGRLQSTILARIWLQWPLLFTMATKHQQCHHRHRTNTIQIKWIDLLNLCILKICFMIYMYNSVYCIYAFHFIFNYNDFYVYMN